MQTTHEGLITTITQAKELNGVQNIIKGAVELINASHDGKGTEQYFQRNVKPDDFKLTKSAFRTLTGKDHTFFTMDIDAYIRPKDRDMLKILESREVMLEAVMRVQEIILNEDPNFFAYLSGKGGYLIRKTYPAMEKRTFIPRIRNMLTLCDHEDHESYKDFCIKWRRRYGNKPSFYRWVVITYNDEKYEVMVTIDLSLLDKSGIHMFRIPYSIYPKVAGHFFICSPVLFDGDRIDVEASIKNTHPAHTRIIDFEIPVEHIPQEDVEGYVVDTKAMMDETKNRTSYKGVDIKLDIPTPLDDLSSEQKALLNRMENSLTAPPTITPPCMKNAYVKKMPDDHRSRILLGRYLLQKGYTLDEIALFIRFRVNDAEDNAPENWKQMERNIKYYLAPTGENPRMVPKCSTIQNKNGNFYACSPEDAKRCGRTHPLGSPRKTEAYKAKIKAEKEERYIEMKMMGENAGNLPPQIGKFKQIIKDVGKLLENNKPVLVKKTTRAGLTTSLIISSFYQDKRSVVLEPTNRIAKQTFPEAVSIAKNLYDIKIKGAVLSSNPTGCLKVKMKLEKLTQLKDEDEGWGDDGVQLAKMPVILKPPCATDKSVCEFFDDTFDIQAGSVITESRIDSLEYNKGKCARISVLRNLDTMDTVFATYAKMVATLNDSGDESLLALSEFKNFDIFMLDEISTLMDGQPTMIRMAGSKNGELTMKGGKLKHELSVIVKEYDESNYLKKVIEKAIRTIETRVQDLNIRFIRGGVKTIIIENPLTKSERDNLIRFYAIVQNVVEKTNKSLRTIGAFILSLTDDQWYMTAVTNMYKYTSISLVTKPELSLLKQFINDMIDAGKKIVVTDASLPPMSMKALLDIDDWDEVNLGDPRGTNDMSLIIPDSKKVNVSTLERNEEVLERAINFARKVLEQHGVKDTTIVMPNSRNSYHQMKDTLEDEFGEVNITYFRSDKTVGVANEKRTMIVFCKPLPPDDAYHWLATHYSDDGSDVQGMSQMLRNHSARQAFYQTIGRAKDPSASEPSVIYTYGLRKNDVEKLIGDYHSPKILSKSRESDEVKISTGTHWRRTGELLPPAVTAAVELVHQEGYVTIGRLKRLLKPSKLKYLLGNLSMFAVLYNKDKERLVSKL